MNFAPELLTTGFCPFAQITGKPCVLCGGSRALFAICQGDIDRAVEMNSSVVLFVVVFALYIVFETTTGKVRRLAYLFNPREIIDRSGRSLSMHPRGTIMFGLIWWLWNIQRWG